MNDLDRKIGIIRTGKAYSIAQAARLAETSPATVRRWLFGYDAPGHRMSPVFGARSRREESPVVVSFLELAEIIVVSRFRQGGPSRRPLSLARMRRAHEFAREQFGPYPFASLRLIEFGGHVLHEFEEQEPGPRLAALDMHGQYALPQIVEQTLITFEYDGEYVSRWYPRGKDVPIVVDPRYGGGQPTVLGRGVTVDIIRRRFKSGQSIEFIAEDYDLEASIVQEAIRFAVA